VQAAAAGEVAAVAVAVPVATPFVASGKLLPLATIGAPSSEVMPGVPPLASAFPDSEMVSWQAVFAPAKTPQGVIDTLQAAIQKVLATPDPKLRDSGTQEMASSPAELGALLRADYARNGELAKRMKLKVD
jgi:tripartite-type tricarboxylate transporter receptor subunit TctC